MFTRVQKINFIPLLFLEILLKYCELVIFVNFGMFSYGHQKQWYQAVENFNIYLHARYHIYPSIISRNIANLQL